MALNRGSEKNLLEGFCAGDEESAKAFVRLFRRRLCWIAVRIVGDSGAAEDVTQIAFERAWRNGASFDAGRGSLNAWMTSIAHNAALDWVRVKRAIPTHPSQVCRSPSPGFCDLEDLSCIEETRAEIRSALTTLPPTLVRCVVLSGAFGLTAAEVARHEHLPLGTAKSRIRSAKQRLRKELETVR